MLKLETQAALTIFNTIGSSFLICCGALSPLLVMIIDGILSLFWALVFGTLSRAMGKTTFETCNAANWGNSDGIIICHLYKSLFAFTALGWYLHSSSRDMGQEILTITERLLHLGSFSFASVIRRRTKRHAYAPAPNPANLHTQKTSYNPTHSSTGSRSSEYGASAPPVYASAPNYTAGKDETYA